MPDGVVDRDADVWEALLAVADAAGNTWPERARRSAVALVADSKAGGPSLGVRLLADLRDLFGNEDKLSTEHILAGLHAIDEAPWGDLRGRPLDPRGLSRRLAKFEVKPTNVRTADGVVKGYTRDALLDAWSRYLPDDPGRSGNTDTDLHSSRGQTIMETGLGTPGLEAATSATPLHACAGPGICRTAGCPQAEVKAAVPW
jgi:hypothetical protein